MNEYGRNIVSLLSKLFTLLPRHTPRAQSRGRGGGSPRRCRPEQEVPALREKSNFNGQKSASNHVLPPPIPGTLPGTFRPPGIEALRNRARLYLLSPKKGVLFPAPPPKKRKEKRLKPTRDVLPELEL